MGKLVAEKHSKSEIQTPLKQKLDSILGKPQLLVGDDHDEFIQIEAGIVAEINPQDVLENLWCRDVVERSYEIFRLRRWRAQLIEIREMNAVRILLNQSSELIRYPERIDDLVNGWGANDQDTIDRIYEILTHTDRRHSHIEAQVVGNNLESLTAIENLLLSNELRRDSVIREIERHRDMKAKRGAIEGGFKEVKTMEAVNDHSKKD